jgi:exosortase
MNVSSSDSPDSLRSLRWKWWVLAFPVLALWGMLFWRASFFWGSEGYYFLSWLVPPLAVFFLWGRLQDVPPAGTPVPIARPLTVLSILGVMLALFMGETMPFWRPLLYVQAFWTVMAAIAFWCSIGGVRWVRHFYPLALFVLVALPWAESVENPAVQRLTEIIARLTEFGLNFLGFAAEAKGNQIEIQDSVVEVGDACSGIRSFQGLLMIGVVVGELYRLGFNRLTLVLSAFLISFPLNAMRALVLSIIVVESGWEAYNTWHDPLGGIVYAVGCALLLGFAALIPTERKRRAAKGDSAPNDQVTSLPIAIGLVPGVAVLLLFAGIQAWFAYRESPETRQLAWSVEEPDTEDLDFQSIRLDPSVYDLLNYDGGVHFEVMTDAGMRWDFFDFLYASGTKGLLVTEYHTPDICMARFSDGTVREIRTVPWSMGEKQIFVRGYHITYPNGAAVLAFQGVWIAGADEDGVSRFESMVLPAHNRLDRFRTAWRRALSGRRDFPIQVFLIATDQAEDLTVAWAGAESVLREFLQPVSSVDNPPNPTIN